MKEGLRKRLNQGDDECEDGTRIVEVLLIDKVDAMSVYSDVAVRHRSVNMEGFH